MTLSFRAKTRQGFTIDSPLSAFTFPGGEAHITGTERLSGYDILYHIADLRGADSHELLQLAMWADALKLESPNVPRVLILPYLPGARADKVPTRGAAVYADFLCGLGFSQIISVDPHSSAMPGFFESISGSKWKSPLTVYPFERIIMRVVGNHGVADTYQHPYVGVIAPDKGAVRRSTRAANVLRVPVFLAEKTRDFTTGKLSGFTCEDLPAKGKLLIVDDICDGGGTFNGLAETINIGKDRLDLWVTHGIFSKGIATLSENFGKIYTTNSHPGSLEATRGASFGYDIDVIDLAPYLYGTIYV